ncbi:hypothetical protein [Collimonas fungivorans]|uniref:hypothetical protein n=1 Tax=Collimonas fungivorans TaxID=158899 RepID=UPI00167F8B67|nr:hypothetical protein [Collimonas fungivorans]
MPMNYCYLFDIIPIDFLIKIIQLPTIGDWYGYRFSHLFFSQTIISSGGIGQRRRRVGGGSAMPSCQCAV